MATRWIKIDFRYGFAAYKNSMQMYSDQLEYRKVYADGLAVVPFIYGSNQYRLLSNLSETFRIEGLASSGNSIPRIAAIRKRL